MAGTGGNYNPNGKGGFGDRPHTINRKGRPKDFVSLRQLAKRIAQEPVLKKDGEPALDPEGKPMTRIQAILYQWAMSPDYRKQKEFVEVAFGKVPTEIILQQDMSALPDEALEKVSKGKLP